MSIWAILGSTAGAVRAAHGRADQRRFLRHAVPWLALIFGMLNIINFAHGALYMMGAFAAYLLLEHAGIGYCRR